MFAARWLRKRRDTSNLNSLDEMIARYYRVGSKVAGQLNMSKSSYADDLINLIRHITHLLVQQQK